MSYQHLCHRHFWPGQGQCQPCKNVLVLCLITVQNFVTFSHTMCMHTGGPQTLRDAGAHTCDWGVATPPPSPPRNMPFSLANVPDLVALGQTLWA